MVVLSTTHKSLSYQELN